MYINGSQKCCFSQERPALGAFFATNVGKWYFASVEAHTAFPINVWAHERKGTPAAKCPYPSWLQRPSRALHGWLVYVSKNQAAVAIQVRKRHFSSTFYTKNAIILPRQARDKHGKSSTQKGAVFVAIQRFCRGWLARLALKREAADVQYFERLDEKARVIQARYRGHSQRVLRAMEKKAAVSMQKIMRGHVARSARTHIISFAPFHFHT